MILYHATPMKNTESIKALGFLAEKSVGKIKAVWLHAGSQSDWAILHTARRKRVDAMSIKVYQVKVPRSWLKRHAKGKWYCTRDIPFNRVVGIIPAWVYAERR